MPTATQVRLSMVPPFALQMPCAASSAQTSPLMKSVPGAVKLPGLPIRLAERPASVGGTEGAIGDSNDGSGSVAGGTDATVLLTIVTVLASMTTRPAPATGGRSPPGNTF